MNGFVGSTMSLLAVVALMGGCQAPGVGDPCIPESIPEGGFVGSEAYLETSSVQCRTRVCIVYQLQGVPYGVAPCRTPEEVSMNPTLCAPQQETNDRVYCTCRCDAPPEATATLCECPESYSCHEVIDQPGAPIGIRGSYCLKNGTFTDEG